MDNIERFENEYGSKFQTTGEILQANNRNRLSSEANYDTPNLNAANGSMPLGNIYASDTSKKEYASSDGKNNNQNSLPNPNDIESGFTNQVPSSTTKMETFVGNNNNNTCFDRDRLTSSDLLPLDAANSKWAQINPAGSGMLGDQNFLTAGYHMGINTIGQSLRNANLQLRSEPPNPQVAVSPWGISTIEPDIRTTTLEIGSAPSY